MSNLLSNETSTLLGGHSGTDYESDGETQVKPVSMSASDVVVPPAATEGDDSVRQRRRSDESSSPQRPPQDSDDRQCGLVTCYKKILSALPAIGDSDEEGSQEANEAALRFGAQQIIQLIVPVTICMAAVVAIQLLVTIKNPVTTNTGLIYTPFNEQNADNGGFILLFALGNVAIILVLVVVMTFCLVLLFKYKCYLIIRIWLMAASGMLLFFFFSYLLVETLKVHNLALDWLTFILMVWNFGAMGLMVIHWKGPLRLQQAYLIITSVLAAYVFVKYLPDWTTWLLLFAISIYDIVAVLCPKGPLRILVETSRERNVDIFPALIYSSTMLFPMIGMADSPPGSKNNRDGNTGDGEDEGDGEGHSSEDETGGGENDAERNEAHRQAARELASNNQNGEQQQEQEQEEPRGFKLGLGDFIFYSILVGKAAHDSYGDWVIISSCFVAILIGLCMTTLILGIVRRALPALPISITFGLIFYFTSRYVIAPFAVVLATTQTFI